MINLSHISSIYSESWVAWVLFALLVVALSNPSVGKVGVIWHGVFSQAERTYSFRARAWADEITLRGFQLGIVAMAILMWIHPMNVSHPIIYAKVLGVLLGTYVVQSILVHIVAWVFLSTKRMDAVLEQRNNIRTLVCIGIYPILLLWMNVSVIPSLFLGLIIVLFFIMLIGKSLQLFYTNPLSILYILLYIFCLEILPIVVSVLIVEHLI